MKNIKWFSVFTVAFIIAAIISSLFGADDAVHHTRTLMYSILALAVAVLSLADRR